MFYSFKKNSSRMLLFLYQVRIIVIFSLLMWEDCMETAKENLWFCQPFLLMISSSIFTVSFYKSTRSWALLWIKTVLAFFDIVLLVLIKCLRCVLGSSGLELLLCFNSKYGCITNLIRQAALPFWNSPSITIHRIFEFPPKVGRSVRFPTVSSISDSFLGVVRNLTKPSVVVGNLPK